MTRFALFASLIFSLAAAGCSSAVTPTLARRNTAVATRAAPTLVPVGPSPLPVGSSGPSATLRSTPNPTAVPAGPVGNARTPASMIGTPVPPPALAGQFVFAPGDGSIWLTDAATHRAQAVLPTRPGLFPDDPAFSPDGARIVYTLGKFMPDNNILHSIHVIDTDGKNDRTLVTPADPLTELSWPVFSPDGKWIYYTTTQPVPPNGTKDEVHRIRVDGRGSNQVLDDGELASLSADGNFITFLRFDATTFGNSLWVANVDGRNPKKLVAESIFQGMLSPRFSPDGRWIVFSASGPPSQPLPGALLLPRRDCRPSLLCIFAEPAHADGLPWDLWLVSSDGAHFQQLTNVGFDSPWPAWSGDGKYIAIFETSGFYVLDLDTRLISQWSPGGGHGAMDWWMARPK